MIKANIHWGKTGLRIREALYQNIGRRELADAMGIADSSLERKTQGENLTIEDLVIFSRLSGEPMESLIIFEEDIEDNLSLFPSDDEYPMVTDQIGETPAEDCYLHMTKKFNDHPIKTLKEFLLYLPLIDAEVMGSFIIYLKSYFSDEKNCEGELKLLDDLDALYWSIDDSPAKRYADYLKKTILRSKFFNMHRLQLSFARQIERENYIKKVRISKIGQESFTTDLNDYTNCNEFVSETEIHQNMKLSQEEKMVMELIRKNCKVSVRSIAKNIERNQYEARKIMDLLKSKGVLSRIGSGPTGYWELNLKHN